MKRITLLITFINLLCISIKAQEFYNVTVHINAGELKDSLTQEQLSQVQDLVVSGSMNYDDLSLIQNNMPKLKYVNLRNVDLDTIPKRAFYDNGVIFIFKLPLHIKYLDDYSFAGKNIWLEVTGEYPRCGEDVIGAGGITISPDNEYCKTANGEDIYSMNGKTMYRFSGYDLEIKVEEGTEIIASRAFEKARIKHLYFPSTLLKIEENVFKNAQSDDYGCPYHDFSFYMAFKSKNPPLLAKDVFGTDDYTQNCYIWVPKGSRELYLEADPQWALFDIYEEEPELSEIKSASRGQLAVRIIGSSLIADSPKIISSIEVFDSLGKLITLKAFNTSNVLIPFTNEREGIYFVKVSYDDYTNEIVKVIY